VLDTLVSKAQSSDFIITAMGEIKTTTFGAEESRMAQIKRTPIRVWKAPDLQYVRIGSGEMQFCNPISKDLSDCHAGYLDVRKGTLDWKESGDEIIWVLKGQVTITHGDDIYQLGTGDMIFMCDGIKLRMTGSEDARIAYVSHVRPPQP
jgi:ethanolamine utilization protein EutQ (cupin superfamily)